MDNHEDNHEHVKSIHVFFESEIIVAEKVLQVKNTVTKSLTLLTKAHYAFTQSLECSVNDLCRF